MRHLRQPSQFLRTRNGERQRKCLDCGRWLPESTEHYNRAKSNRKNTFSARCRPCYKAYRIAHGQSTGRGQDGKGNHEAPLPPTPPNLTWGVLLACFGL